VCQLHLFQTQDADTPELVQMAFFGYLVMKGDNAFFGAIDSTDIQVDSTIYMAWKNGMNCKDVNG
jgi:hypothetical protein